MVSGTHALSKQVVIEVEGGSRAAAPSSGWDLDLWDEISTLKLGFWALGPGIWASKLDLFLKLGFELWGWDFGLEAGICASGLYLVLYAVL